MGLGQSIGLIKLTLIDLSQWLPAGHGTLSAESTVTVSGSEHFRDLPVTERGQKVRETR